MIMLKHELTMNLKSLLIWALCVGICCCGCILLFDSVAESMGEMAESFAGMGSFSAAFGMDKISIATLEGFYAAEVSIIFSLGGAMFAAMTGAVLLSKEEEGHTTEFLYTLPLGRGHIFIWKYLTLLVLSLAFNLCCIGFDVAGFLGIGAKVVWKKYFLYHTASLLMQIEIGSICFWISACSKRKQIGLGLGIAVFFYLMDIMCRIVPDIEGMKYLTPFYYANAADLFSGRAVEYVQTAMGMGISVVAIVAAWIVYSKRDLSV